MKEGSKNFDPSSKRISLDGLKLESKKWMHDLIKPGHHELFEIPDYFAGLGQNFESIKGFKKSAKIFCSENSLNSTSISEGKFAEFLVKEFGKPDADHILQNIEFGVLQWASLSDIQLMFLAICVISGLEIGRDFDCDEYDDFDLDEFDTKIAAADWELKHECKFIFVARDYSTNDENRITVTVSIDVTCPFGDCDDVYNDIKVQIDTFSTNTEEHHSKTFTDDVITDFMRDMRVFYFPTDDPEDNDFRYVEYDPRSGMPKGFITFKDGGNDDK